MDDAPPMDRLLWMWTGAELVGLTVFLGAIVFGAFSLPPTLRAPAVLFLAVELLIPTAVYLDMRRRGDVDHAWIHAAAVPLLNVVGLLGYLAHRRRPLGPSE